MRKPEWISGNVFIRPNPLPKAGDCVKGHRHHFDHTTIVFTGAVHVRAVTPEGCVIDRDFHAPSHFLVKAEVEHEITAIEDGTEFWCVYSHRDPQGRISIEKTGWEEAYR